MKHKVIRISLARQAMNRTENGDGVSKSVALTMPENGRGIGCDKSGFEDVRW